MKNLNSIYLMVLLVVTIGGCAHHYTHEAYSDPYGFFSVIWHGMIFPVTLLVNILSWLLSLLGVSFLSDIQIIGQPNTGFFYYTGFIFGLSAVSGSSTAGR